MLDSKEKICFFKYLSLFVRQSLQNRHLSYVPVGEIIFRNKQSGPKICLALCSANLSINFLCLQVMLDHVKPLKIIFLQLSTYVFVQTVVTDCENINVQVVFDIRRDCF